MTVSTEEESEKLANYSKTSMLDVLLKKLAYAISVGGENSAAANEVRRQMSQIARRNGGDPISGNGITKSTEVDENL